MANLAGRPLPELTTHDGNVQSLSYRERTYLPRTVLHPQIAELTTQISTYEDQVKLLIANGSHPVASTSHAGEAPEAEEAIVGEGGMHDAGNDTDDDDDDDETEDRFVELEEDLANVIADVHDLGEFSLTRGVERGGRNATRLGDSFDINCALRYRSLLSFELHRIRQNRQGELFFHQAPSFRERGPNLCATIPPIET